MNQEQKNKSVALIIPALVIQIGCLYASKIVGEPKWLSLTLAASSLVGLLLLIAGSRFFAKAKGYGDAFGLLGFFSILGIAILVMLPDKTK